jgi:glutamyl-Q tRNA(Asp) synthetase
MKREFHHSEIGRFNFMAVLPVTRFAPSPTGWLHLGHAFSALFAYQSALAHGGRFLLRIEDIDFTRCRREFETDLLDDLTWLGLEWEWPVRRQAEHLQEYALVASSLQKRGLLYPCFCTRREILKEIESAGGAPHGSEGPLYPGLCRNLSEDERQSRIAAGQSFALRLDLAKAREVCGDKLEWVDLEQGTQKAQPELLGDVVLVRKDIGCSYHLAVVHDDALQGVTRVTRGMDLWEATHLHRLLQALLGLEVPDYHHHTLLTDLSGRRLAKRDNAETLRSLRQQGFSAAELKARLARWQAGSSE